MQDHGRIGGAGSVGDGINACGQVTGYARTASGDPHAFLYSGGSMQDLGTLGGTNSQGFSVSATGEVAGDSWISGNIGTHAFLYSGGSMHDLNAIATAGWELTNARGMNDYAQITGFGSHNG